MHSELRTRAKVLLAFVALLVLSIVIGTLFGGPGGPCFAFTAWGWWALLVGFVSLIGTTISLALFVTSWVLSPSGSRARAFLYGSELRPGEDRRA